MHPTIALFPSSEFYQGRLENAKSTVSRDRRELGTGPEALELAPVRFFNVNGKEEAGDSHSLYNAKEVEAIFHIFSSLVKLSGDENLGSKVGVIALYNEQVTRLRARFKGAGYRNVDISTVDGFQGREKEIIFLSCVRGANNKGGLGFLRDKRRINVAITRARDALYVVGCAPTLSKHDEMWSKLVDSTKSMGVYVELDVKQKGGVKRKKGVDVAPGEDFVRLEMDHLGMTNEEQSMFDDMQESYLEAAREKAKKEALDEERAMDDYNTQGIDELVGAVGAQYADEAADELDEGLDGF